MVSIRDHNALRVLQIIYHMVNDILEGMQKGLEFAFTMHSSSNLGLTIASIKGLPYLIYCAVVYCYGRSIYLTLLSNRNLRDTDKSVFKVVAIVLSASLVVIQEGIICLVMIYMTGAILGVAVGIKNGIRIRSKPMIGWGILLGMLSTGLLSPYVPEVFIFIAQVCILTWLIREEIKEFKMNKLMMKDLAEVQVYLGVVGIIALGIFDDTTFTKFIMEASRSQFVVSDSGVILIKVCYYLPAIGLIIGLSRKPTKKVYR